MERPSEEEPNWIESTWAHREENVYAELFGELGPGIYTLGERIFAEAFRQSAVEPAWLHLGAFESPPNRTRKTWLYVTSGLSNPWEDQPTLPDEETASGLGIELVLETPEQSLWALQLLKKLMAHQILVAAGRLDGQHFFQYGDRLPLGAPIDGEGSPLTWLLVNRPTHYNARIQLASGTLDFLHFVGVAQEEAAWAAQEGSDKLVEQLRAARAEHVTDPGRVVLSGLR